MKLTEQLATHFKAVYFGGNWTAVNFKDTLSDVTWQQATTRVDSLHSIAALVFHVNYFVRAALQVLNGGPLDAKDKFSFDLRPIECRDDWERLLNTLWEDAERLAELIERMPEDMLWEDFANDKYGSYYRNLQGIVEHNHYHLGQIALIKAMIARKGNQ